ncbi:MAG TPA: EamA family transporter, partial [Leptospiraceae bacterium]|nr:EamA family transporter [Leptospiraceae bacterium]
MRYSADAVLIFCTLLWGLTFSLVKESLSETGPLYINVLRFVFSGVLFLPAAILRRRQVRLSTVTWGFGLGVLLFYGFAFQTMGLGTTTAQRSAFLTQMLV